MARAFWKGAISFGMVAIPVKMYVATTVKTPAFHLLHKKCLTRPEQVLHCPVDGEYFSSKETVRGYEYTKGQFVTLEESDFTRVRLKTLRVIQIMGFVKAEEIDHTYYRGSHYLEPEELGIKPFILLREALRKTDRAGIAKVAFQRREHLCCLRPLEDILVLHTLHYADEILPREELAPMRQEIHQEELDMAVSLITAMARRFHPEEYKDDYRQALQNLIRAKVEGREIKLLKEPKIEIPDLMSALRASIEAAKRQPTKLEVRG